MILKMILYRVWRYRMGIWEDFLLLGVGEEVHMLREGRMGRYRRKRICMDMKMNMEEEMGVGVGVVLDGEDLEGLVVVVQVVVEAEVVVVVVGGGGDNVDGSTSIWTFWTVW